MERLAFTPAEIAAAAGLSRKAIYRAIQTGELRGARVCSGSRLLIPADAARDWIELHIVMPRKPTSPPQPDGRPRPDRRGVLANALRVDESVAEEA
jgi:excisionase family DNA binding protein